MIKNTRKDLLHKILNDFNFLHNLFRVQRSKAVIFFPKGGWLDEDHISAADIDEDGNATVDGEEGRTYDVHIDN